MAPPPFSPAPGTASGPPAPPFDPHALNALLDRDPARAAAILAAMRPALRAQQAQAHADLAGVTATRITQEWRDLIARCGLVPAPPERPPLTCVAVYDPETLANLLALHPQIAYGLLSQLSTLQRVAQALAYTEWMDAHGFPVSVDEILMDWKAGALRGT